MRLYEVPIDERFRAPIETIVARLAASDWNSLVECGHVAEHAREYFAELVRQTETALVPLPSGWWSDEEAVMFPVVEPDKWCALLPLWSAGGRGPLWLEVDLCLTSDGVRVDIERLYRAQQRG